MVDPETLVVKGGTVVLAALAMVRVILWEIRSVRDDFTAKRKRR